MFILMSFDGLTKRGIAILHAMNPEEKCREFKQDEHFLLDEKGAIEHEYGNLPTRFTFLGHSHSKKYGDTSITAKEFASQFAKNMKAAAALDKRLLTSKITIDLIGCEIGLTDKDKNCYAQEVADELLILGLGNIRVKSFTTLSAPNPETVTNSVITCPVFLDSFQQIITRTPENFEEMRNLKRERNKFIRMQEFKEMKNLYDSLTHHQREPDPVKQQKKLEELAKLLVNNTEHQAEFNKATTFSEKMSLMLSAFNKHGTINFTGSFPSGTSKEFLTAVIQFMDAHYNSLNDQISTLKTKMSLISEEISSTNNIREHYDHTPICTFRPNITKAQTTLTQLKNIEKNMTKIQERLRESHALFTAGKRTESHTALEDLAQKIIERAKRTSELGATPSPQEKLKLMIEILGQTGVDVTNIKPDKLKGILPRISDTILSLQTTIAFLETGIAQAEAYANEEIKREKEEKHKAAEFLADQKLLEEVHQSLDKELKQYNSDSKDFITSVLLNPMLKAEKLQNVSDFRDEEEKIFSTFRQDKNIINALAKLKILTNQLNNLPNLDRGFSHCLGRMKTIIDEAEFKHAFLQGLHYDLSNLESPPRKKI